MVSGFSGFQNLVVNTSVYHERVHQGVYFETDHFAEGYADDDTIEILVQVGDIELHARHWGTSGGQSTVCLFEAPTFSDAGASNPLVNRNRETDYVATASATLTPILVTDGEQLDTLFIPGGSGGNSIGAAGALEIEWLLRPNTAYLWRMQNIAGVQQAMHLHLEWYEDLFHDH